MQSLSKDVRIQLSAAAATSASTERDAASPLNSPIRGKADVNSLGAELSFIAELENNLDQE